MIGRIARGAGSLLVTCGVLVLLFVGWELWGTSIAAREAQHRLGAELQKQWHAPAEAAGLHRPPRPANGQPFAVLTIQRLGSHYRKVLVQGVDTADLQEGPGHYTGSAWPGQIGNFAVAGHRTTYGAPFGDLNLLRHGDAIDVQINTVVYQYAVTSTEIVTPEDVAVIDPVPDRPGATATKAMLTFTTCHPKYSADKRLIVHAVLEQTIKRATARS